MAQGTSWDYDFLNRLMKDDYYASALNRDYLKEATTPEWERNSGDPQPLRFPDYSPRIENAPYDPQRGMRGETPGPESTARAEAYLRRPTLTRPGEAGPPMAPPGYGTREYANKNRRNGIDDYNPWGGFVEPKRNRSWKGAIGTIARGAIAGATTPNVVAGGAVDIFRAMQAGGDERLKRDMVAYEMQRQRVNDLRQWENDEQNRRLHRAQMEDWEERAAERRRKGGTPEERQAQFMKALKKVRGLPDTTLDAEVLKTPITPDERLQIEYALEGNVGALPASRAGTDGSAPHYVKDDQGKVTIYWRDADGKMHQESGGTTGETRTSPGGREWYSDSEGVYSGKTGEYKTQAGPSRAERYAKQLNDAIITLRGLPKDTPHTDPRVTAPIKTEEAPKLRVLMGGSLGAVPQERRSRVWPIPDEKGNVQILEEDANTPGEFRIYDPGIKRRVPGGATQHDIDAKEATSQAYLIWKDTSDWLIKNGKITGDPAKAAAENEIIYKVAASNAGNSDYFSSPRHRELLGLIIDGLDSYRRARNPPVRPDPGAEIRAAIQAKLKKDEEAKRQGAPPPAAAPPVAPPPAAVVPPVAQNPIPTTTPGYVSPPLTQPQQTELDKAKTQLDTQIKSQTPAANANPNGKKSPAIPFPRTSLRRFFDGPESRALGFKTLKEAEDWLTANGYVIK